MTHSPRQDDGGRGLYIMSLSVHGLVRGQDMELGRDADTGGQVSYVVDQARALAERPEVEQVDLVTRLITDRRVDARYSEPEETLSPGARIVRLPFGPRRYLHKETLWPYLPSLTDQIMRHVRAQQRAPDLVHGHYADAGFVGSQVARILGVPFLFTGHSLGRIKRARLLAKGSDEESLEERYRISQRIEAEETALETAAVVIASTRQEVKEQYEEYDHYEPDRMVVIPPGVDLSRFSPPPPDGAEKEGRRRDQPGIVRAMTRFLADPSKPMVLAMARPDERKNLTSLLDAFGTNEELRRTANLVIIAGNRDDIGEMAAGPRRVLTEILLAVDRYDLYGSVAYPKEHAPTDVPEIYKMAAASGGVFVNPALTEPFGLTLIEAAASGLPIVATNDGGPRDIVGACENGILFDPMDTGELARALIGSIRNRDRWTEWSRNGIEGVHRHFSWPSHAKNYLGQVRERLGPLGAPGGVRPLYRRSRLPRVDRILVTDIDNTLTGDREGAEQLLRDMEDAGDRVGFAVATGRPVPLAVEVLDEIGFPLPDILIAATGTEILYGPGLVWDRSFRRQIDYHWNPEGVLHVLESMDDLDQLHDEPPAPFRLRFRRTSGQAPDLMEIRKALRSAGLRVTATLDHGRDLDITPIRASPGLAIRFISHKWRVPPERILVAGDSGNDADMLAGETLGVVVGNHTLELEPLRGRPRVFFSERSHAFGILDGIRHYDFFGSIRLPESTEPTEDEEGKDFE